MEFIEMQYKTFFARDMNICLALARLDQKVEKAIEEGWKPQGGVATVIDEEYGIAVCQAMVR